MVSCKGNMLHILCGTQTFKNAFMVTVSENSIQLTARPRQKVVRLELVLLARLINVFLNKVSF